MQIKEDIRNFRTGHSVELVSAFLIFIGENVAGGRKVSAPFAALCFRLDVPVISHADGLGQNDDSSWSLCVVVMFLPQTPGACLCVRNVRLCV